MKSSCLWTQLVSLTLDGGLLVSDHGDTLLPASSPPFRGSHACPQFRKDNKYYFHYDIYVLSW